MAGALTPKGEQNEYERGFAAGYKSGYESAQNNMNGGLIANWDKVTSKVFSTEDADGEALAYNKREESKN